MKTIFKLILKYYLKYITKLVIFIHRPIVVAVAGSTNKAFIKNEIKKELEQAGRSVRANPKSFNTEIGLPLAILDLESGYNSYRDWLPVIVNAAKAAIRNNFPKYLVLEMGISKKGDMEYLLTIIRPEVAVISDITQRYLESFSGMEDLAGECQTLVRNLPKNGAAILNFDNSRVRKLKKSASASKVIFFGRSKGVDYQILEESRTASGEKFILKYGMMKKEYEIKSFGAHNISARAASAAVINCLNDADDRKNERKNQERDQ